MLRFSGSVFEGAPTTCAMISDATSSRPLNWPLWYQWWPSCIKSYGLNAGFPRGLYHHKNINFLYYFSWTEIEFLLRSLYKCVMKHFTCVHIFWQYLMLAHFIWGRKCGNLASSYFFYHCQMNAMEARKTYLDVMAQSNEGGPERRRGQFIHDFTIVS